MNPWRALLPVALLGGVLGLTSPAVAEEGVAQEATLTVQHDRVGAVRHRLDTVVEQLGGEITTEQAVLVSDGQVWQVRVVIRVPARRFDTAANRLGKLGTLVDQSVTAEDLATRIADLESVVVAQRAALARVEALAAVRPELRTRRAELARHEGALAALTRRVGRPTITLRLVTEPSDPDPPTPPGFLWWRLGLALLLGLAG